MRRGDTSYALAWAEKCYPCWRKHTVSLRAKCTLCYIFMEAQTDLRIYCLKMAVVPVSYDDAKI